MLVGDRRPLLLQYRHCVPFQSPPLQPRFPLLLALRQSVGFSRSRRRGFLHLKVSHVAQRHPNCGTFYYRMLSVLSREKANNWCLQKCAGCCLVRNIPIQNNIWLDETYWCSLILNPTLVSTWDELRLVWYVRNGKYLSIPSVEEQDIVSRCHYLRIWNKESVVSLEFTSLFHISNSSCTCLNDFQ